MRSKVEKARAMSPFLPQAIMSLLNINVDILCSIMCSLSCFMRSIILAALAKSPFSEQTFEKQHFQSVKGVCVCVWSGFGIFHLKQKAISELKCFDFFFFQPLIFSKGKVRVL